jgi:hypothetical protein
MFDARRYTAPSEAGISKKYCATNSGSPNFLSEVLSIDHIVQIFELGGLT